MERPRERGLINLLIVKYSNLFKKDYKLMKQRILYIDRIKGLAIILVVVGHLYTFNPNI